MVTKPRATNNIVLACAAMSILVGGLWFVFPKPNSGGPEHLFDTNPDTRNGPAPNFTVKGELLYWSERFQDINDHEQTNLYSQSIHGGTRKTISSSKFAPDAVIGEGEVLFLQAAPSHPFDSKPWSLIKQFWFEDGEPGIISGFPFQLCQKSALGQLPVGHEAVARPVLQGQKPPILTAISLHPDGSVAKIQDIPLDLQGYALDTVLSVLTPKGLYWIRPDTKTVIRVVPEDRDGQGHLEMGSHDTLMFTPIGGKAHEIQKDCAYVLGKYTRGHVYLMESGVYPYLTNSFVELSADGSTPPVRLSSFAALSRQKKHQGIALSDQQTELAPSGANRLLYEGRYYWVEGNATTSLHNSFGEYHSAAGLPEHTWFNESEPVHLMSMCPDGSDVRLVAELRDKMGHLIQPNHLFQHQRRLYLIYSCFETQKVKSESHRDLFVACLHPNQPQDLLGESILLANHGEIGPVYDDAGYLYYSVMEPHDTLVDVFSVNATQQFVRSFWRLRLPE